MAGTAQAETAASDGAQEEPGSAAKRECRQAAHARAVGAAGVGENGLEAAQPCPAEVGDSGQVAQNQRCTEGHGGAQTAHPVHLAGKGDGAGSQAAPGWDEECHRSTDQR